ncbi:MAG: hypothetical protein ACE5G8_08170 [Anaerolineae bacterium]
MAQLLTLYSWGVACILLLFLFAIARFFEQRLLKKTAGNQRQLYYPFILVPIILFAASAIIYAVSDTLVVGNGVADSLRVVASLIFGVTGYSLFNTMMGGRS